MSIVQAPSAADHRASSRSAVPSIPPRVQPGAALRQVRSLNAAGAGRRTAIDATAARHGISPSTLRRWLDRDETGLGGRLDAGRRGRPAEIWERPGATEAFDLWATDYLRLERPTAEECLRRVLRIATVRGWQAPHHAKAFLRRLKSTVPHAEIVRAREGAGALLELYPAQERSVAGMAPLDRINGDGHPYNLLVVLPSGKVGRPVVWHWQDVRTRRLLECEAGETESADLVRLSLHRLITIHGVPGHVHVDSTRAAANRWLTGRQRGRRRGGAGDAGEVPGILHELQIGFSAASIWRDAAGRGKGRGQSKPVERAFADFAHAIETHPLAAGAYTGRSVVDRPETHRARAIPWELFLRLLGDGVAEHNARQGRRTEAAAGRSFDDAWNDEIPRTVVRRLSEAQAALLLLPIESTVIGRDGAFRLKAGRAAGVPANRYTHTCLADREFRGRNLPVRFDPGDLHAGVHVYRPDGRYLCRADCIAPVGFADTDAAREHERQRRRFRRATEQGLRARERMDELIEASTEMLASEDPAPPAPEPAAVRLVTGGPETPAAAEQAEAGGRARRAQLLRGLRLQQR